METIGLGIGWLILSILWCAVLGFAAEMVKWMFDPEAIEMEI